MDVNDRGRPKVRGPAAGIDVVRRVDFTWSGARRVTLALGIVGLALVAGWSLAGLDRLVTRFPVDVSRRQNLTLQAQREALRANVFGLGGRLAENVEHGRRIARLTGASARIWQGQYPRPPAREAGGDAVLAWLEEEGSRLDSIGNELAVGRPGPTEMIAKRASTRAPLIVGWVSISGEPALVVADHGAARQSGAASAQH